MNLGVLGPLSKSLSLEPEQDPKQTPQSYQRHIRHDRRNITVFDNPRRDELTEAVAPDILVYRDGDKQTARNGFVGVDCVSRSNGRDSGDLDTAQCPADYDDDLLDVKRGL